MLTDEQIALLNTIKKNKTHSLPPLTTTAKVPSQTTAIRQKKTINTPAQFGTDPNKTLIIDLKRPTILSKEAYQEQFPSNLLDYSEYGRWSKSHYDPVRSDFVKVGTIHVTGTMPDMDQAFPKCPNPKLHLDYQRKRSNHRNSSDIQADPFYVKKIDIRVLHCFQRSRLGWFRINTLGAERFVPARFLTSDFFSPVGKLYFRYELLEWHFLTSMMPCIKHGVIEIWIRTPSLAKQAANLKKSKHAEAEKLWKMQQASKALSPRYPSEAIKPRKPKEVLYALPSTNPSPLLHPLAEAKLKVFSKSEEVIAQKEAGAFQLEICDRCRGGELENCPACDGSGYLKYYGSSKHQPSRIKLSQEQFTVETNLPIARFQESTKNDIQDHSSIGRSDPLDVSKGMGTSFRDGGKFGSMPSYDDFDN